MNEVRISTQNIVKQLMTMYPDQTQFRKNVIVDTAKSMNEESHTATRIIF